MLKVLRKNWPSGMKMHISNDSINYFVKQFWKLWTCTILCHCSTNFDVILPNFMFYEDVNTRKWENVKNSSPKKLSADCWSTVDQQSANSWLTVGQQLAGSWPTVVYHLLRKFSANSRLTVGRLSANCWQPVGNVSAKCQLRMPVEYQKSFCSQGRTLHFKTRNGTFSLE